MSRVTVAQSALAREEVKRLRARVPHCSSEVMLRFKTEHILRACVGFMWGAGVYSSSQPEHGFHLPAGEARAAVEVALRKIARLDGKS